MGKKIEKDNKLISDFLDDCHIRGMTERSVQSYKSPLNSFFCDNVNTKSVNYLDDDFPRYLSVLYGHTLGFYLE